MGYQEGGLWQPDAKAMEAHAEGATEGHMKRRKVHPSREERMEMTVLGLEAERRRCGSA